MKKIYHFHAGKNGGKMRFKTELLEDYRWNKRWSKKQMSEFLGISPALYFYILQNGQNDYRKIMEYARKMDIKFEDLIEL